MKSTFDVNQVREQFPALQQEVNGFPLVYLDSAATALKPQDVIDRIHGYYTRETANVHRGAHFLADQGTAHFEASRKKAADFLGVKDTDCILFTYGTTDSINLVADSFARAFFEKGDEIVISDVEHHANIVPWQVAAERYGLHLRYCRSNESGVIEPQSLEKVLGHKTKMVALTHSSNTLGVVQPCDQLIKVVREKSSAKVLLDGAQYVAFHKVDLESLDADFYTFSGHKIFGPYGVGVLYGKRALLEKMPPYRSGGSMIHRVDLDEGTSFNDLPFKFEAGTPAISAVVGLGASIDFVESFDRDEVFKHEKGLVETATERLKSMGGVTLFGDVENKVPIISFNLDGAHHSDVGQIMDQQGVAVRVGHHCTQPLMKKFGITGTVRASFSIFNNDADVDRFVESVEKSKEMLL